MLGDLREGAALGEVGGWGRRHLIQALVRMSEISFTGKEKSFQVEGAAFAKVKGPQRKFAAQRGGGFGH